MHPAEHPIVVTHDGDVSTIVLQRPETSNLVTLGAMRQLISALEEVHAENTVVLQIRARGDDFSLGRDQQEQIDIPRRESLRLILRANDLLTSFPGVSVCTVQGRAFGFGAGLATQSDITIASATATFAFDEVRHRLAPLVIADYLPQYVGRKAAYELLFTGREVSAEEAQRLGMVSHVVPADELDAAGASQVSELRRLDPGALRMMKQFQQDLRHGRHEDPARAGVDLLDSWISAGRPAIPAR